jgi:hypothetical protein
MPKKPFSRTYLYQDCDNHSQVLDESLQFREKDFELVKPLYIEENKRALPRESALLSEN